MMKRAFALALMLSLLLVAVSAASKDFEITSYSVDITAEADGTLHVKEEIGVHFFENKHGIYRDIQYRYDNSDNIFDPYRAEVYGISATLLSKTEKEDRYYRLYLGDRNSYAPEYTSYTIEYDYRLDSDRNSERDELYYNIISPAWDAVIADISWSITMPSPVERERIKVYVGEKGGTEEAEFTISSSQRTLTGGRDMLNPYGALTVRIEMDEGYWKGYTEKERRTWQYPLCAFLSILILSLVSVLWFLWGRDRRLSITESPLPPSYLSPFDCGYIVDESLSPEREGLAMLFFWADRGYISIENLSKGLEVEKEGKEKGKGIVLHRISGLPEDAPESEKLLFSSIFKKDDVSMRELAASSFASDFLTSVMPMHRKEMKCFKNRKSSVLMGVTAALSMLSSAVCGPLLSLEYPGLLTLFYFLSFTIPSFTLFTLEWYRATSGHLWNKGKTAMTITESSILLLFLGLSELLVSRAHLMTPLAPWSLGVSFIALMASSMIAANLGQRTPWGAKALEDTLGYRMHLERIFREGTLSDEDMAMWSVHSSYAHALGLDTKLGDDVKEKLSSAAHERPGWYTGETWDGNFLYWQLFYLHCRTSYREACTNVQLTSTSGGGGFSGGGFSGGGGGAW